MHGFMNAMLTVVLFFLGYTHYRPLSPMRSIAAGEVVRSKDVCEGHFWSVHDYGFVLKRSQIVGHKALVPLNGGTRIKLSQVDPEQSSWAKDLWDVPDPNDHSYIHCH